MDIGFLIDGEERKSLNGAVYERHDPFTCKVATRAAAARAAASTPSTARPTGTAPAAPATRAASSAPRPAPTA